MNLLFKFTPALALLALIASTEANAQNYNVQGFTSYTPGYSGRVNSTHYNGGFSGLNPNRSMPVAKPIGHSSTDMLEQALNSVDNRAAWARTPVSGNVAPQNPVYTQQNYAPGTWTQQASQAPSATRFGKAAQGLFPGVSKQEMMRVFMEGGSPMPSGGGYAPAPTTGVDSSKTSTAYSNYQTAENEARKALYEANNARNRSRDQWSRKNSASAAEYAANNANYAAQRAESAAYSGDGKAQSYANLARQAANRARNSANQARYNADTIR